MVGLERPRSAARMSKTNGAARGYGPTLETNYRYFASLKITPYEERSKIRIDLL